MKHTYTLLALIAYLAITGLIPRAYASGSSDGYSVNGSVSNANTTGCSENFGIAPLGSQNELGGCNSTTSGSSGGSGGGGSGGTGGSGGSTGGGAGGSDGGSDGGSSGGGGGSRNTVEPDTSDNNNTDSSKDSPASPETEKTTESTPVHTQYPTHTTQLNASVLSAEPKTPTLHPATLNTIYEPLISLKQTIRTFIGDVSYSTQKHCRPFLLPYLLLLLISLILLLLLIRKDRQFKQERDRHTTPLVTILFGVLASSTLWMSGQAHAQTTPEIFIYQGQLLSSTGAAITTTHTFRFSFWSTSDWVSTNTTSTGAIHEAASTYSSWQEVQQITPTNGGVFSVELGSGTALPTVDFTTHKFLQVEVKTNGSADTEYELIDPTGDDGADARDRMRLGTALYSKNTDAIKHRIPGYSSGNVLLVGFGDRLTSSGDLIVTNGSSLSASGAIRTETGMVLNFKNAATDVRLTFGNALLPETIAFLNNEHRFEFSDDVHIVENLTASGALTIDDASRFKDSLDIAGILSGSSLDIGGGHVSIASSGVTIFNQLSRPINFRIESDNEENLFFVHGALNRIGIGTSTPDSLLEIVGVASGRTLHAQDSLSTSGSLTVGTLSNCTKMSTSITGKFTCGVDVSISQLNADDRFVNIAGDTMTGALTIQAALSASGILATESNITINKDNALQDAVVTFGNAILQETITFSNAAHRFEFSDDTHVVNALTTSGSFIAEGASRIKNNLDILGTLSGSNLYSSGTVETHRITGTGSTPSIAAGAGAGSSPTVSVIGSNLAGIITISTGTLPVLSSNIFTITFTTPFQSEPVIIFSPGNNNSALLNDVTAIHLDSDASEFSFVSGTTALLPSTSYVWHYFVIEK